LKVVGKVTGVSSVAEAAQTVWDAVTGDPEAEKAMQQFELEKMKELMKESESIRALWAEEIKSGDAFVRRARPWGLYLGYTLLFIDLGLLSIINAVSQAFSGPPVPCCVLPTMFYGLFTTMFTGSLVYRAYDKRRKIGAEDNG
jgi:hypothetical protein